MASLNDMLMTLERIDDDLTEMTDDDIAELLGGLRGKVDSCREVLSHMEAVEARLAEDIKLLTAKKQAMKNSQQRFREYMVAVMSGNSFEKLPGDRWDMKLMTRVKYTAVGEATEADYARLGAGLVRRKVDYSFDHARLTAAYKQDPALWVDYMTEGKSQFIKFNVHK